MRRIRVGLASALLLLLSPSWLPAMTDVTDRVQLLESSWRKNASEKSKFLDVALENTSQVPVWAPIRVVIDDLSDSRVVVANADGVTEDGRPYFEYFPPSGLLLPGEMTESREWLFQYPHPKVKLGHGLTFSASVWGCTDADFDGFYLEPDCGTTPDCNDGDPLINPAAEEVCDEVDNNCSGEVDEGVTLTFYLDSDADGYGVSHDTVEGCFAPVGYVDNSNDCNDNDSNWWERDDEGGCLLAGYTDCGWLERFSKQCNPAVTGVIEKLEALDEARGIEVEKDKFSWGDFMRPGRPCLLCEERRTHLQSIQVLQRYAQRLLLVTMSDESSTDNAHVSLVLTNNFGSEATPDDYVLDQYLLRQHGWLDTYDHAGGAQLIGEWLFVALEDFDANNCSEQSPAMTGVWKIEGFELEYKYVMILPEAGRVSCPEADEGEVWQYKHTAVGVTKLKDGRYLVAACVVNACDTILFYRSRGSELAEQYDWLGIGTFEFLGKWEWDGITSHGRSDCAPQNMNLVVDSTGDIYMVMFGNEKGVLDSCGGGNGDDHLFVYKLDLIPGADGKHHFDLAYEEVKVDIKTGVDPCGALAVEGTNFEAGSGLWIRPHDISVVATEHYDSCGSNKSRWGVTGNWDE